MAAALSLSLSLDPHILHFQKLNHLISTKGYPYLASKPPLFSLRQLDGPNFRSCVSSSSASAVCASVDSVSTKTVSVDSVSAESASVDSASAESASGDSTSAASVDDDPFQLGRFVTKLRNEDSETLKSLEYFVYFHEKSVCSFSWVSGGNMASVISETPTGEEDDEGGGGVKGKKEGEEANWARCLPTCHPMWLNTSSSGFKCDPHQRHVSK